MTDLAGMRIQNIDDSVNALPNITMVRTYALKLKLLGN
jgi:hypothetical protein